MIQSRDLLYLASISMFLFQIFAWMLALPLAAQPIARQTNVTEELRALMGKGLELRDVGAFRGQSTRNYSAEQWNKLIALPDATGHGPVLRLSDELDEVAIQAIVNDQDARRNNISTIISLPAGVFRLSRPVKSGCKGTLVRGAGSFATTIVQTIAGQDGWHHGTADTPCRAKYFSRIDMEGLQILATGVGGTALVLDMDPASGGVTLENMIISGFGNETSNFWHDGIDCHNCSISFFSNINIVGILGGDVSKTGAGLSFKGNASSLYDWYGGSINGFDLGVFATSGDGHDLEGFIFDGININNVNIGYLINWNSGMRSPQWYIVNGQYGNVAKSWINATGVSEIEVSNNLTYASTPAILFTCATLKGSRLLKHCSTTKDAKSGKSFGAGHALTGLSLPPSSNIVSLSGDSIELNMAAVTSEPEAKLTYHSVHPTPFVSFSNVQDLVYRDNKQEFGASRDYSNNIDNIISIKDSVGVKIISNFFSEYGTAMTAGFRDGGGNEDLFEKDNSFAVWKTIPKCIDCLSSGKTARWATYYEEKGCELSSSGLVTCTGSSVGQLDRSREVGIRLPSPLFLEPPGVSASNGDFGALASPCGPVASSVTKVGFLAKCSEGSINWPVRINWTAVGR